ncbi:ATP-binding protein [Bacteroidota bacterium]
MPRLTKQFSGKNRIMISIYVFVFIVSVYFIVHDYLSTINQSQEQVLEQLKSIVCTASLQIDGDLHHHLAETYQKKDDILDLEQDKDYFMIHQQLIDVHAINMLQSPIYTLIPSRDSSHFEYIITSGAIPYYRHSYIMFPEELLESYYTGGKLGVHESENGVWISAFAPIMNNAGDPVALLQADMPIGKFRQEASNKLITNMLIAFLIFSNVGMVLARYIKKELTKEEELKQDLLEKNEEISHQNERIEKQKDDLSRKNEQLQEAQKTIENQNTQLKSHNKLLDQKVFEKTRALQETNEELSNFLYRSSHDLIGPVASLKGLINLLKNENPQDEMKVFYENLDGTVDKLDNTIRNTALVHELKRQELTVEDIDPREMITEILSKLKPCAQGIEVDMDIPEDLVVQSDNIMLKTIFRELIKNSCQYQCGLDRGKTIIQVSGQMEDKGRISFSIKDNGAGIPDNIGDKVFEMFYRGNEESSGQGLGLYMVNFAISRLNGKISFESKEDQGTIFTITIPTKLVVT